MSNTNAVNDSIFTLVWLLKIDEEGHVLSPDETSTVDVAEDAIRIFPNPTSDYLYIEHDDVAGYGYEIYDEEGRLVVRRADTEAYHTYMLSTSAYPPGLYYLIVIGADGRRQVHELVLQR